MKLVLAGLSELQNAHRRWVTHNFPNEQSHSPLLGLAEEVGELAHAHLKREQKIRGTEAEHQAAAADAIGDIVIYLASYCNRNGYDLASCVRQAWDEVSGRDWVLYPDTGKPLVLIENMADFEGTFGGHLDQGPVEVKRDVTHWACPLCNDHSGHYWKRPGYRAPDQNFFCRGVGELC